MEPRQLGEAVTEESDEEIIDLPLADDDDKSSMMSSDDSPTYSGRSMELCEDNCSVCLDSREAEADLSVELEEMETAESTGVMEETAMDLAELEEEEEIVAAAVPEVEQAVIPFGRPRTVTPEELHRVYHSELALNEISAYFGPYRIIFDVVSGNLMMGRIIIMLSNFEPELRKHFYKMADGNRTNRSFSGTIFHRKTNKFIEGGVLTSSNDTSTVESLYTTKPVNNPKFYSKYVMIANRNIHDDYRGTRFLITTSPLLHCDQDHIPLGTIVCGREIFDQIAELPCDQDGKFLSTLSIHHSVNHKLTKDQWLRCGKYEKPWQRDLKRALLPRYQVRKLSRQSSNNASESVSGGRSQNHRDDSPSEQVN
ncbi:Protein CBG27914 [Caenorhabditis briggsae]|uniref:Protein CBG27914 n=3 Tax=Caenorhabditis briggsae TaxID=6238 RepID=B6IEK9_CAEBR|nr:Protein CBG27914 [Caenorhabditis briggsae]UMM42944.1 hypothetical protein L5515_018587 [Caenorhabditis briggsae]CAR98339.1 Protein CBG27914 [Caenorhabditis briggsae]